MGRARSSALRLLAKDWRAMGLAIMVGALWLVLLAGLVFFPTPGGEDPLLLGIFGGMAALATGAGAAWALRRWRTIRRLLAHGVPVRGRVLSVYANAEDVWAVLVGYAFDGREYQTRTVTGFKPPHQVGDAVSLLVDPAAPSRAMMHEAEPRHARVRP
jgi:hypothetical protein